MGESMRGSRLGSTSYETDSGRYAPRELTTYICENEHWVTLPFSADADEIPDTWPCACGSKGLRQGVQIQAFAESKYVRTHWDMLLERRSIKELEGILKERLEAVRAKAS